MKKIGLLLIATAKYHRFIQQIIDSADKFFLKEHEVTYFLFTDSDLEYKSDRQIVKTNRKHQPWPFATLLRYNCFNINKDLFADMDYLFYSDVDMLFVDNVDDEILSDRVATLHPGYVGKRGDPETDERSLAYISPKTKMKYFAGGFNGGSKDEFLKMVDILNTNISTDLQNNIVAKWHDESHLNKYFISNKPTKILDPSYCYPENLKLPYKKILLALDKNHQEIRTDLKCAVIFFHKNINKIYKERWWRKSVESMLSQTYSSFDIFEINYGDSDFSVIADYSLKENQNHFFYSKNLKNHVQAMNFIIDEAFNMGYDIVFNTNLDDFYDVERINVQMEYVNMGYDVISSDFEYITDFRDDDILYKKFFVSQFDVKTELEKNHNIIAHPNVCITKKFWSKLRYNDKLVPSEDLDLWKRGIKEGFKFLIIPKILLHYRLHDSQTSYNNKIDWSSKLKKLLKIK